MYTNAFSLLAFAGTVLGHMHLHYPPTLKGDNNPYTQGSPDPYLNYNYGCCGREVPGPCKGHLDLVDTDEGQPVATWAPGQTVNFTLSGRPVNIPGSNEKEGGTHYGGSCSVGFSTDKGKSFKVATTWQGNCPLREGSTDPSTQNFDFTIPGDIPGGERVIFKWNWINREQEYNEGCAVVTISGNGGNSEQPESPQQEQSPQQPQQEQSPQQDERPPQEERPQEEESPEHEEEGSGRYTLEGCTCSCPYETWNRGCYCYECKSPVTKRHLVERKALEMHKRHLQNAEKLNVPVRRAEAVAFSSRPEMLSSIDFPGATCQSKGGSFELEFPHPGPNVVQGDGEYELATPDCS